MTRFFGQYEVLQDLRADFPGAVLLASGELPGALRPAPPRTVVIRRFRLLGDPPRALAALRQRLAALEAVADPRTARVHEVLEEHSAVVLEHVHGVTLANALTALQRARRPLPPEVAVEIGCEIAEVLHGASACPNPRGAPFAVLHRRIKPSNLFLCPGGRVRLLEYGVAPLLPWDAVGGQPGVGDLAYQSPEQARGEEIDLRSDLFSLGLVLFELLSGQPAWPRADRGAQARVALEQRVRRGDLREACHSLAEVLPGPGDVVARMLEADPDARYPSGAALVADLRRSIPGGRGAQLPAFCELFFRDVHPLGADPNAEEEARPRRAGLEERIARAREPAPPPPPRDTAARRPVFPPPAPPPPAEPATTTGFIRHATSSSARSVRPVAALGNARDTRQRTRRNWILAVVAVVLGLAGLAVLGAKLTASDPLPQPLPPAPVEGEGPEGTADTAAAPSTGTRR